MSWDIVVQDLPADATTVEAIPADFVPRPLGPRADIIAAIRRVAPAAFTDFTDPAWGHINAPTFSIDVNLGRNDVVRAFTLHVRGGDEAVACVAAILDTLGVRAIDTSNGEFFSREAAVESFGRWRAYRDQVIDADN
jgi:hypothetical protein